MPVTQIPVDEFVDRLKKICGLAGNASALAKKAGISNSGLSRYLGGGDPSRKVLVSLALAAGVNLNWLATGEGPMEKSNEAARPGSLTMLPFLGALESPNDEVIPGRKKNLTSQAFCRYWLGSHGLDSKALAAMHIRGDSMSPTIRDEDLVLIDVTTKDIQDDKIYVIQDASSLLVRRLQLEPGGRVRALCDNPTHREFEVHREALEIVGRVVWRGALL
ncbi:MAG: helix-turn-helix transcriptional regulator [Candidatus Pseudomonas colombiensis]|nr:MAG: helix-turn-helix transcriptional regulator [Pseudomonas sp.]